MTDRAPDRTISRYLAMLGLRRRPPEFGALAELVRAHLLRVPFENLSKLLRRTAGKPGLPTLGEFLDGIERHRFGGTCYAVNFALHRLLRGLGYDARLCGADMSAPDVHLVNVVSLDGREYLVDAGYAAPFFDPFPLDTPAAVAASIGPDTYALLPRDADGRSRVVQSRDGVPRHGYRINPAARTIGEFAGVIADSFAESATFMNAVRLVGYTEDGGISVHNFTVHDILGGGTRTTRCADRGALCDAIVSRFGMTRALVEEAVASVPLDRDPWEK